MSKIPARLRGVSLISLMIAITIASFLLAGLFQIWFQTRQTFTAQGQLALLQDSERMALTIMANTVQTGGYYPIYLNYPPYTPPSPVYSQTNSFPVTAPFTIPGQSIFGTATASPTGTGDTLEVRFVADANTLDCLGQPDKTGSLVINTYSVTGGNLVCAVDNGSGTVTTLPIVTGVQNLAVLYNVAIPGSAPQTYQYMSAASVTSGAYWGNVQSVDIKLTFNNPLSGQPGQHTTVPTISRVVELTQTAL